MHGTTLHLFVILFPVQYMGKRFVGNLFDKNERAQNPARVEEKGGGKLLFFYYGVYLVGFM